MLTFLHLEFAILGAGEHAMVEFIRRMEKKLPLDGLAGMVRRKNNRIVEENPPMRVQDLNTLPPARSHCYIDLRPYRRFDYTLQIQTQRGCAIGCFYCTYNLIEGERYRLKDPHRVANEIEYLVEKTGINHIEFTDSTFNIPLNHTNSVHYASDALSQEEIKVITKRMAFKHPNYFMYDEDENTPLTILWLGTFLIGTFAPKQPVWKLHVVLRSLQKMVEIGFLKRQIYED